MARRKPKATDTRGPLQRQTRPQREMSPTPEQIGRAQFKRDVLTHVETATRTTGYRRKMVIAHLLDTEQITQSEYEALAYYRDQASLAEKSPVRSCCDNSPRSGHGPGVAILSAALETGRIERDLGVLVDIARAIAVDDKSLAQWCIEKFGGRERYNSRGEFVAIVPVNEKRNVAMARMEIRMAARRIVV